MFAHASGHACIGVSSFAHARVHVRTRAHADLRGPVKRRSGEREDPADDSGLLVSELRLPVACLAKTLSWQCLRPSFACLTVFLGCSTVRLVRRRLNGHLA